MRTARELTSTDSRGLDQRVLITGVRWRDYEAILAMRGESSRPRVFFLKGVIELVAPSGKHEDDKKTFSRLVEAWSEEVGIDLQGYGSWTLKNELAERGAEPDECYILLSRHKTLPPKTVDLAIEVVRSSGGLDKLEIYRALGVREVWFWDSGVIHFHVLRSGRYTRARKSALLPTFDALLITKLMTSGLTQPEAVRRLRRALRG